MERIISYLPVISLCVGGWDVVNGLLHDIFVLIEHWKKAMPAAGRYDRDLLRLLMDGHILITCGILQMLAYKGLQGSGHWGYYISGVACISLLVYCGMIFPFLRSFGTIFLNASLLFLLIMSYFKLS